MTIQVGTEQIFNVAYMYGLSGIQFYQPIEIGGNEISVWNGLKQTTVLCGMKTRSNKYQILSIPNI